jgi:hypothetical protein
MPTQPATDSTLPSSKGVLLARRLLQVAWMSILLGIGVELVLVIIAAIFGATSGAKPLIADAVQKVSWSVLVCSGIALGTAAAKSARKATMGLLGLLSAPLAFAVAKAAHKAVAQGLGLDVALGPSPLVLATLKGLEFAFLGAAVGWLATKSWAGMREHLLVGLVAGVLFGGAIVAYTLGSATTAPETVTIVTLAANELIYPIGCAVVLYAAGAIGIQLADDGRSDDQIA